MVSRPELGHPCLSSAVKTSGGSFHNGGNCKSPGLLFEEVSFPNVGSHAMFQFWNRLDCYVFSPFSLIHRVLLKIRETTVLTLLVALLWPRQSWFPLFFYLFVDRLLVLPFVPTCGQDRGRVLHPRVRVLHLHSSAMKC